MSYECGLTYHRFQNDLDQRDAVWRRDDEYECEKAFDTAVQLRRENERLKAQLAKWQNWQPDDEDLCEMKQQAQGGDGTYTDSLAANAVYIGALEATVRTLKARLALCHEAIDKLHLQQEELKD